jgi:hypothetical protein
MQWTSEIYIKQFDRKTSMEGRRHGWKESVKIDPTETWFEGAGCIALIQDRVHMVGFR